MLEIQLIGNLGQDPEARYTAEGTMVVTFPVATKRRWTDRDGQKHEETTWVDITAWGNLAEICHQHLTKGRQVFVRGRPEVRAFTRKNGEAGAALRVTADEVIFLGGKPGEKMAQVEAPDEDEVPF
ncbi:single-stranded DNA-binding protein [Thermanaerothrix sp.]|jgi:single-strand DNA-binding protein|uniref:single-stranded DNA-binding protein n=1 Tax=Thermanaerothrix sp. TaxID=2972675 RepID=UPI002ADD5155|nr:single-stranded DNA-binding protein [Thermanaerothrix sp.]